MPLLSYPPDPPSIWGASQRIKSMLLSLVVEFYHLASVAIDAILLLIFISLANQLASSLCSPITSNKISLKVLLPYFCDVQHVRLSYKYFGVILQERCVAPENIYLEAKILRKSKSHLQSMLMQHNAVVEEFYANMVCFSGTKWLTSRMAFWCLHSFMIYQESIFSQNLSPKKDRKSDI